MTPKQVAEAFETIAEEAIRSAEQVDCTLEQFEDGLTDVRTALQDRLDLVRDEIRAKGGGVDDEPADDEDEDG